MRLVTYALFGVLAGDVAYFGSRIHRSLTVLGVLRKYPEGANVNDAITVIPDTVHCEDLHYHAPSGTLFTACEDNAETRFRWFPPLANFDDPELASRSRGSIHVVDPKTLRSRRLKFENFDGPYITHGIDVIPDKERTDDAVYIFAVNHVPETHPSGEKGPHARSQLEVFHHIIGSSTVKHLRSVWHPLIKTPNDIFAQSSTSLYVTNDHYYRNHGMMRTIEDLYRKAKWTEVVHIHLDSLAAAEPNTGVTANVALPKMHNTNGLGHGRLDGVILISSCTSGTLHIGHLSGKDNNITVVESIKIDHVADNPSYFADPYATPGDDRSGILETGLARAVDLGGNIRDPAAKDPVMVTYIRHVPSRMGRWWEKRIRPLFGRWGRWEKRVLFEDDGTRIRSGSAAVLVAIDPAKEGGSTVERKAWLFVTGFMSQGIVAVKVDL